MARVPSGSTFGSRPAPSWEGAGDSRAPAPAPLRFDAREDDAPEDEAAGAYRVPRASRWRVFRIPLAFSVLCGGAIVLVWLAWTPVLEAVADGAGALAERADDGRTRASVTVALGAAAMLAFVVAWWRASHPRRPVRLSDDRGRITVDAIAGQLRALVLDLDHVRDAEVVVENRGRGRVRTRLWLRVEPEARIDDILDGVDEAAEWLVQGRLGLLLAEPPLADVRYDELDLRAGRAAGATTPDDGDA